MSQYYKKYMKKREEEKPSYLKLFLYAFVLMIVFFIIVATHLTSSVDISIGENDEGDIKESGLGVKHLIDSRLRFIQMEDAGRIQSKDIEKTNVISTEAEDEDTVVTEKKQTNTDITTQPVQTQQHQNTTLKPITLQQHVPPVKAPTPSASPAHQIQINLTPAGMN